MAAKSKAREREDQAVRLRLAGLDFDAIATQLGYRDRSAAWKAYKRGIERRRVPDDGDREDDVHLDLARLDELQARLWPKANRGDLAALDRVLRIMERRDQLRHRYYSASPERAAQDPGGVVVARDVLDDLRERRAGQ